MKKAVFIDTNGGFDSYRYEEIVETRFLKDSNNSVSRSIDDFQTNLYVIKTTDTEEFIDILTVQLTDLTKQDPNISVIVIDCFAHLLKTIEPKVGDELQQCRIMHELVSSLQKLAFSANVAVVLTNEFTTKFCQSDETFFVPSLGTTFHHRIAQRLTLSSNIKGDRHFANLEKSKYNACRMVEFKVKKKLNFKKEIQLLLIKFYSDNRTWC